MRNVKAFLVPTAAVAALFAAGCGSQRDLAYKNVQIAALEEQIGDLKGDLAAKEAELAAARSQPAPVAAKKEAIPSGLEGLDVKWRNGELVITLENDILFAPGSATLTAASKSALGKVASVVKQKYGAHFVRVEGHTDSDPIKRSKDKWEDNWDLSGGRARAVLRHLIDRGISEDKISFAGYAYTRPRDGGDKASSKSRNRRVEIVVLPNRSSAE